MFTFFVIAEYFGEFFYSSGFNGLLGEIVGAPREMCVFCWRFFWIVPQKEVTKVINFSLPSGSSAICEYFMDEILAAFLRFVIQHWQGSQ